jgi:hypothetical protein
MPKFLGYFVTRNEPTIFRITQDGPVVCICDIINNLNPETTNEVPKDFRFLSRNFPIADVARLAPREVL